MAKRIDLEIFYACSQRFSKDCSIRVMFLFGAFIDQVVGFNMQVQRSAFARLINEWNSVIWPGINGHCHPKGLGLSPAIIGIDQAHEAIPFRFFARLN